MYSILIVDRNMCVIFPIKRIFNRPETYCKALIYRDSGAVERNIIPEILQPWQIEI